MVAVARAGRQSTGQDRPHSIRFSGGGYQCSSKAARSEDLQVEHPIRCGYSPTFDFHPTLPRMHSSPLIRYQVVQVCQPRQKRLLAAACVVLSSYYILYTNARHVYRLICLQSTGRILWSTSCLVSCGAMTHCPHCFMTVKLGLTMGCCHAPQ